jgi:hypothetical protein
LFISFIGKYAAAISFIFLWWVFIFISSSFVFHWHILCFSSNFCLSSKFDGLEIC